MKTSFALCLAYLLSFSDAAVNYCGSSVDEAKLPQNATLFYEHDENGKNMLQKLILGDSSPSVVSTGGNMVLAPALSLATSSVYLMTRSPDDKFVLVKRYNFVDSTTEIVFSEPATSFPFLIQAPAQVRVL